MILMIAITGEEKSDYYSSICSAEWAKYGYSVERFEATTPDTLGDQLNFADKKFSGNPFTPTEKAIWYSHFRVWQYVLRNGPANVIEHDTYPMRKLESFGTDEIALFATFPRNDRAWLGREEHIAPGAGYYITKTTASLLIEWALMAPIEQNVDGHIYQSCKKVLNLKQSQFEDYHLKRATCFQIVNYDVGTSAEHNV